MTKFLPFIVIFIFSTVSFERLTAQSPFPAYDSINVNNINARQLVHGDMWSDPTVTQTSKCEFPKGSGKNISYAGSLWMSGYDAGNQLHITAQTYRSNGNDYWPGPLDASDTLTYATSKDWARIWKVNASDISTFLAISTHTTSNTPQAILEWPAKGSPYAKGDSNASLTVTQDMAPFVDVNNDGIYNPLQGDYPAIKGDQALWCVYSDNGPAHDETNGLPLKVEVHAMAYAYSRGTLIDNVVFYEYTIYNKSTINYTNFRIGQWADMDLGYSGDDYVGFDSSHRMGITYNGAIPDGNNQSNAFGNYIPMAGVTMLLLPGDNPTTSFVPAGSFMYFIYGDSVLSDPSVLGEYNNYLRSKWKDSTHLVNNFQGRGVLANGHGTGNDVNYIFTGDPIDTLHWSECNSGNPPGDRRLIITTSDFTFNAGTSQKIAMALVTTDPAIYNACPDSGFDNIKIVADTAWNSYYNIHTSTSVSNIVSGNSLHIYPNPAHDKIYIETPGTSILNENILVYNALGQVVNVLIVNNTNKAEISLSGFPSGVYYLLYRNNEMQQAITFIKD